MQNKLEKFIQIFIESTLTILNASLNFSNIPISITFSLNFLQISSDVCQKLVHDRHLSVFIGGVQHFSIYLRKLPVKNCID